MPLPALRAEGSKPGAKQKAFVTGFASAQSPASYWAPKKPHGFVGGFFGAWLQSGRGGVERGYPFYRPCIPVWVQYVEKVEKPAKSGLTNIDLLMEVALSEIVLPVMPL